MNEINKQAVALNKILFESNSAVYELLAGRGREIFFPHSGILGQTAEAKGKKYNATIGMACEDDGSIVALDAIAKNISVEKEQVFPYASSFGNKELREIWQRQILKKNPLISNIISLPVVTNALTHGLSVAGYLFCDSDSEIVLAEPFWGNYNLIFNISYGAKLTPFPLFKGRAFNVDGLKEILNQGVSKKILLLNFPNNPTGYTPTDREIDQLVAVMADYVQKNQLVVLCDDAYFGLVYEKGVFTESIFAELCDFHENLLAVKLDGCTKEDFVWGFRIGFITFGCKGGDKNFYTALENKAAGAVRATISNASNISQALLMKAFVSAGYENEKAKKRALLQARYEETKRILSEHEMYRQYFTPLPFNSGYFMCVKLSDKLKAEEVRQHLLKHYDTGVISIDNMIRVAFSSVGADKLQNIFDNLYKTCKELAK